MAAPIALRDRALDKSVQNLNAIVAARERSLRQELFLLDVEIGHDAKRIMTYQQSNGGLHQLEYKLSDTGQILTYSWTSSGLVAEPDTSPPPWRGLAPEQAVLRMLEAEMKIHE